MSDILSSVLHHITSRSIHISFFTATCIVDNQAKSFWLYFFLFLLYFLLQFVWLWMRFCHIFPHFLVLLSQYNIHASQQEYQMTFSVVPQRKLPILSRVPHEVEGWQTQRGLQAYSCMNTAWAHAEALRLTQQCINNATKTSRKTSLLFFPC